MEKKEAGKMAEVRKPGRPKKYKAAAFEKAVEAYFNSISYEEPYRKAEVATEEDGTIIMDHYGHPLQKMVPVVTADGQPAKITRWVEPPSIRALCLYLGIDKSTFDRYGKLESDEDLDDMDDKEREKFCVTVTHARGRVEAYLEPRLEDKNAQRGVAFNLAHNYGWKEKKEISLDQETRQAVETAGVGMTDAQRLQWLKERGVDVSKWE